MRTKYEIKERLENMKHPSSQANAIPAFYNDLIAEYLKRHEQSIKNRGRTEMGIYYKNTKGKYVHVSDQTRVGLLNYIDYLAEWRITRDTLKWVLNDNEL